MISSGEKLDISDEKRQSKGRPRFSAKSQEDSGVIWGDRAFKGSVSYSQVHAHSHWCLEIVALSLEFSVR